MTEVFLSSPGQPVTGRAVALRKGMLTLMARAAAGTDGTPAAYAHPFAWAPFFLVGEGHASAR
jgi:hypothetical protein